MLRQLQICIFIYHLSYIILRFPYFRYDYIKSINLMVPKFIEKTIISKEEITIYTSVDFLVPLLFISMMSYFDHKFFRPLVISTMSYFDH